MALGQIVAAFITDYLEAISFCLKVTRFWSCTRRIQAVETSCCCRMVLDH